MYRWGIIGQKSETEAFARAITDVVDAKLEAVLQSKSKRKYPYLESATKKYENIEDIVLSDEIRSTLRLF